MGSTPGYDGSIRISTAIDTKSFNTGMKKLSGSIASALGGMAGKLLQIGQIALLTASTILAIGAALVKLGQMALSAISKFVDSMFDAMASTDSYRQSLATLKTAFDTLKGTMYSLGATLLNAVAPALLKIIDFVVKALNWVTMLIAALTGQKTVMQYVAGSINSAAGGMGKLAKNTKDAEKAASGALAAFDQINILQQEKPDTESTGGGGGGGGTMQMQEIPVPENFLVDLKQKILDWIKMVWDRVTQGAYDTLDGIKRVFGALAEWFVNNVWNPLVAWATPIWNRIKEIAAAAWDDLTKLWGRLKDVFLERVWGPLKTIAQAAWSDIQRLATIAWNVVKAVWNVASSWFKTTVIDPLKNGFKVALDWIKDKFTNIFDAVKNTVKNVINGIIGFINAMIRGVTSGINAIVRAVNSLSFKVPNNKMFGEYAGTSLGFNLSQVSTPQIPYLAKGGVIPPNSEFLAVLGDNKSQKEILAPEGLIRQIIQEEMGSMGNQEITINFAGTLGSLVREMKPYIDKEYQRIGKSLIKA